MFKILGAAIAAATLACAGSAGAATIVGTLSQYDSVETTAKALGINSPGRWRITWALSAPTTATQAGVLYDVEWDQWNKQGPTPEGNEGYQDARWSFDQAGTSGFFEIGFLKPFREYAGNPSGHWLVYQFHPSDMWMVFEGAAGAQYEITATFRSAIPEPATWALMIAGFGLTGAAIRRRRFQPA